MSQEIFQRTEKKYILSEMQYKKIMPYIYEHLTPDSHGFSTICNIYFDTKDFLLVRTSLDKPFYKEKIRLRSYGTPYGNSKVFFEIKKKFEGVVYKRRVILSLQEAKEYLKYKKKPNCNKQIMEEIDYCFNFYDLIPIIFIAYDRLAYYGKYDNEFRITFDFNVRSRLTSLELDYGDSGELYDESRFYIMEIKTNTSIPIEFVKILSKLEIYPTSFSKYGMIYKKMIKRKKELYV